MPFNHQISIDSYAEGLKAEYAAATDKDHKAAIKAELDAATAAANAPAE